MKYAKYVIAVLFGCMIMALAMSAHEVERRPEAVCVPLYDKLPLECWEPSPDCPAPKEAR